MKKEPDLFKDVSYFAMSAVMTRGSMNMRKLETSGVERVFRMAVRLIFAVIFLSVGGFTARAQAQADDWKPKEDKAFEDDSGSAQESGERPRVSMYWYMQADFRARCEELVRQIEENLRHHPRMDFKPAQEILEPGGKARSAFERAEGLVSNAEKALFNLELEQAVEMINEAVETYEAHFHGFIDEPFGFQPLERALALQVSAAFQTGDEDLARKALLKMMAVNPGVKYDPKRFPQGAEELFLNLRLERDEFGTTSIRVDSKPGAAMVFLNGRQVGPTPISLPDVRTGYHYVTLRRDGHASVTKVVEAAPPDESVVTVEMERLSEDLFGHLAKALRDLGAARAGVGVLGAGKILGVEILVLGRITMQGNEATVNLFAYDLRTQRLLKGPVREKIDITDLGSKPADLAKELFDGVLLDGTLEDEVKVEEEPPKVRKTMKERWRGFRNWGGFWYTVGGVAGAVVIGAAVGLVLGLTPQDRWDRMPAGSRTVIFKHRTGLTISSF